MADGQILLSDGSITIVDLDDFEYLNRWKWRNNGKGYACRNQMYPRSMGLTKSGYRKSKVIYMHRVINKTPEDMFTDHVNGNTLDNRKVNLQNITNSENIKKAKINTRNKSGYKNISFDKSRGKWLVSMIIDNKQKNLGRYSDIETALKVRNEYVKR